MPHTRDNHYVPQWYQREFFEPGRKTIAYLDKDPPRHPRKDGSFVTGRAVFDAPTSRCFYQTDLYSTFFGTAVSDEIERKLFGAIDDSGSHAVRAFAGDDQAAWHHHFKDLFFYLDAQKIRTPKGLDWLRAQYPVLSQNELMMEMQGIRALNCTIWTEGVREIVSAQDADVKFILSDHPVTIYNHAAPPGAPLAAYPGDPGIALKASQTLFPLGRDFCLILTNLEYAMDPDCPPLDKRTFARAFRTSMVNTIDFIRTRKLSSAEVARINFILKERARRYIAAGREEWLYPEAAVEEPWVALRETLLPPKGELSQFGGEIFARFDDGHVHYQDAFGRTEKGHEYLAKPARDREPSPGSPCGCGSGRAFRQCCKPLRPALRPSWDEVGIRERNMSLHRGIVDILGLDGQRDWVAVRRSLTDEQISRVYQLYQALWPLETDLLKLLPKPDGRPRAIYTGSLHPEAITEFALGASLYFGELMIEHPFVHAGGVAEKFNPVAHPEIFRLEFLKSVLFFLNIMPLVDLGVVNLIPDPGTFDHHLRDQMLAMARERSEFMVYDRKQEPRLERLAEKDFRRHTMMWPRDALAARLRADKPDIAADDVDAVVESIERLKEADPLAALTGDIFGRGGEAGGQFELMKLAPNFEMAMYLAQATGAAIVTDSPSRWRELLGALRPRFSPPVAHLRALARGIGEAQFLFPSDSIEIAHLAFDGVGEDHAALFGEAFRYCAGIAERGLRPNWEAGAAARFARIHRAVQAKLSRNGVVGNAGRISCAFPAGGIQDNTINRLLLMSSSEHHLPSVPVAFFIAPANAPEPDRATVPAILRR